MELLTERYQAELLGVLSCYDRMIITGTLPGACYAGGMTSFLHSRHIKIFDYAKVFADPLRERIRKCAHELADAHGVSIEHVNKPHIRKEDLVSKVIAQRGKHSGLVHILSAMEACSAYEPWHDKKSHKTFLRPILGKCLHYYFYFIDEEVGLCYLRVPTWCPFRLQFYCNGHSWLETKFQAGLAELLGVAKGHLQNALIYTSLIPPQEKGIRRFCLWAIGMAILTLNKINKHRDFSGGTQVKISRRSVRATIVTTSLFASQDWILELLFKLTSSNLPEVDIHKEAYFRDLTNNQ